MGKNDLELQMSLVSVEPPTGYVKAMVGGRDWGYSQDNTALAPATTGLVVQAVRPRDRLRGRHPAVEAVLGRDVRLPDGTTIQNYGGEVVRPPRPAPRDVAQRQRCLRPSRSLDAGVDKTMAMAQRLGADMPAYDPAMYGASVALGVIDVSPLQMASAFGVFADHGKRAPPTPVLQVFGPDGKLIIDNTHAADQAQAGGLRRRRRQRHRRASGRADLRHRRRQGPG